MSGTDGGDIDGNGDDGGDGDGNGSTNECTMITISPRAEKFRNTIPPTQYNKVTYRYIDMRV